MPRRTDIKNKYSKSKARQMTGLGSNSDLDRIDTALKITKPIRENYKTYMDYYRGNQHQSLMRKNELDPIVVNYTFNTVRTIVPTLYFKNPKIFPHATKPEFIPNVPTVSAVVNYDLRYLGVKAQTKRCILRSLIGGISWMENSYAFYEKDAPKKDESDKEPVTLEDMVRAQDDEGRELTKKEREAKFSSQQVKKDSPIIISRSLMEVALDPWANQMDEISWYAVKEILPLKMVKADPRYAAVKNLEANAVFDSIVVNTFSDEYRKKGECDFVELWHSTDRWKGKTTTWARGHAEKLREFDTPPGYDLVPLIFNEDPESNEAISVVSVFKDQQDELNRLRQYAVEHVRRSLPKAVYDSDKQPSEEVLNRLVGADADELIGFPGGASSIQPLNVPQLSPDIYRVENYLKDDMRIGSMLSDFQRGQAVKTPSATEATIIEQSSRLRVDEGLDIVADFVEKVMTNAFKLRQKFTTTEQAVPIIGENNVPNWEQMITYDSSSIEGEYEFTVEYGSTQKKDQDFEKQQWLQLAPILQNLVVQAQQLPQVATIGRALMAAHERPQAEIDALFPLPQEQPPMDPMMAMGGGGGGSPPQQGGQQLGPEQLMALLGGGQG